MKLSIIVPIYNSEKTLHKCIDSIIEQEYTDTEIILVDDGSSDRSFDICKEYAKTDNRIIVYHKKNEGLVAARKTGVKLATGTYVGFVDSDDYIDKDMYSSYMKEAENTNPDMVIGGILLDYSDNIVKKFNIIPSGFYNRDAIEKDILPNMLMKTGFYKYGVIPGVVIKIFKKDLIEKTLNKITDNLTLGEDVAITSYAMIRAESVSIINNATYHYIQNENSMIRGYNPNRFNEMCNLFECIDRISIIKYKNQVYSYFSCILYGILSEYVRNDHFKRSESKKKIRELLTHRISIEVLKNADVKKWKIKDKLKLYLMKYKLVNILTIILAR